mmetsp:Transcript_19705/g.34971  ORF Transcript_19705/g.34971 Transcript_19705/m.34971 type:complete len:299 (+) Transcript_19705:64-960(+)
MKAERPLDGLAWSKATLRKNSFFRHCGQEFLSRLLRNLRVEFFASGDLILREGDEAHKLYCLEVGEVDILVGPDLEQVGTLGEGAVFGEMAMFKHASTFAKRSSTIRAVSSCVCRSISYRVFHEVLKLHPQELQPFQELLLQRLSNLQDPASFPVALTENELHLEEPAIRPEWSESASGSLQAWAQPSRDMLAEASGHLRLPHVDGVQELASNQLSTTRSSWRSSRASSALGGARRHWLRSQREGRQDGFGVRMLREKSEVKPIVPAGIKRISDVSRPARSLLTPRPHSVLGIAGECW